MALISVAHQLYVKGQVNKASKIRRVLFAKFTFLCSVSYPVTLWRSWTCTLRSILKVNPRSVFRVLRKHWNKSKICRVSFSRSRLPEVKVTEPVKKVNLVFRALRKYWTTWSRRRHKKKQTNFSEAGEGTRRSRRTSLKPEKAQEEVDEPLWSRRRP